MEGKKIQPRAILVFGAPCSGKTTFCEKFAARFKAPFFNLEEIAETRNLSPKTLLFIVSLLAKTGQTLVIEGALDTAAARRDLRRVLIEAGYSVSLIWIQTDVATIKSRLKLRLKSVAKAKSVYDSKIANLEAPSESENPIVLSGKHTFETQLKHVLTALA